MLHQNFKGLLTLVFIFTLLVGGFYLYKGFIEPTIITNNEVGQYPISEDIEINPKIEISEEKVVIMWETPFESIGAVMYCLKGNTTDCEEVSSQTKTKKHIIALENLNTGNEYSYKILIEDKYYPLDETSYFSFKTPDSSNNEGKKSTNQPKSTLIKPTESKTSKLTEFRTAILKQDLNYDTNKDGKVDAKDYIP